METTVVKGSRAEGVAVRALIGDGYTIVERNFRCDVGELDVVARDRDGTLVFVEIRSRRDDEHGSAIFAVGSGKRHKVARVAAAFLELRAPDYDECRFDVVAITGDRIEIVRDAWRLGDPL
jgi:putative endonuclease